MTKIGRNDPCPCGSGRKYKHCHGSAANEQVADEGHARAVERALRFLHDRHRRAFAEEIDTLLDDCWPDEADDRLPQELLDPVRANVTEWLLAEGDLAVKGERVRVRDLLLGPGGPGFTPAERAWIEQLGRQPLRLYTVTDVRAGEGVTLVDALVDEALPIVVQERSGSRSLRAGTLLGARVMDVADHFELSGAIYPFSALHAPAMLDAARAGADDREHEEDRVLSLGVTIIQGWLAQHLLPPPLPDMVDASTGEKVVLTTDHYEVIDRPALERVLAAQPDVEGSAEHGWSRLHTADDGVRRPIVSVNPGKSPERIEVFYKTGGAAERGRPWFEGLAGSAVRHLTREISDPRGFLGKAGASGGAGPAAAGGGSGAAELPPEVLEQLVGQALQSSYQRWADEPIPALGGKTPRQAITTPAGLERVKGLLRSYEDKEAEAAKAQRRRPISYDFLWQQLGIQR